MSSIHQYKRLGGILYESWLIATCFSSEFALDGLAYDTFLLHHDGQFPLLGVDPAFDKAATVTSSRGFHDEEEPLGWVDRTVSSEEGWKEREGRMTSRGIR